MSDVVLSAASAALGALVVIVVQAAVAWKWRPILAVEIEQESGYRVERLVDTDGFDGRKETRRGVWLRVRVVNRGKMVARGAKVFATSYASVDDRRFSSPAADPVLLDWAHLRRGTSIDIPPGMGFFADVALAVEFPSWITCEMRSEVSVPELAVLFSSAKTIRFEFVAAHDAGLGRAKVARLETGKALDLFRWRH